MIITLAQLPPVPDDQHYVCWSNADCSPCTAPGCGVVTPTYTAPDDAYDGPHRHIPITWAEAKHLDYPGLATIPLSSLDLPGDAEVLLLEEA